MHATKRGGFPGRRGRPKDPVLERNRKAEYYARKDSQAYDAEHEWLPRFVSEPSGPHHDQQHRKADVAPNPLLRISNPIEYEKAMKAYQASPAYQQYLATSKRQKQANEKAALNRSRMTETGNVVIQPVDEDEYNNDLTVRKLQQLRFDRNNRLVSELFAPIMAPDTRTIVSQSRLDMLRKQASSLESHQKKLQDELIMLDEKHNAKKADIKEKSDRFTEMMKKVCADRPVYDEPFYQRKVAEWDQKIMSAYADFLKQQEATQAELAAKRARQENSTLFKMVATNEETTNIDSILMPPPPLPAPRDQRVSHIEEVPDEPIPNLSQ